MFYVLSKIFDLAVAPLAWAIALLVVSVALSRARPRVSRAAGVLALVVLVVFSSPATATALLRASESGAPRTYDPGARYDAVIVLTGVLHLAATNARHEPEFSDGVDRLLAAWRVFRTGHAANIYITGINEAGWLRDELVEWGVPADRIFVEGASRNTHQSAVETKKAIEQHGWRRVVLVTSARHMPRALGCFRREGLAPDTLPVDYRAGEGSDHVLPREGSLAASAFVLREYLGRVVYRVVGYSE